MDTVDGDEMSEAGPAKPPENATRSVLDTASRLRWQVGPDFHQSLVEAIYADAARIAGRSVSTPQQAARPTLERRVDRIVTSRIWGSGSAVNTCRVHSFVVKAERSPAATPRRRNSRGREHFREHRSPRPSCSEADFRREARRTCW